MVRSKSTKVFSNTNYKGYDNIHSLTRACSWSPGNPARVTEFFGAATNHVVAALRPLNNMSTPRTGSPLFLFGQLSNLLRLLVLFAIVTGVSSFFAGHTDREITSLAHNCLALLVRRHRTQKF
jgi:hypothetical protein